MNGAIEIGSEVVFADDFEFQAEGYPVVIKAGVRATVFGTGPDGMIFVETRMKTVVKVPGSFHGIVAA